MIRGEIWWTDFPEPTASEPGYTRPVIIIQSNDFNRSRIDTVVVVTLSSNLRLADMPGNFPLPSRKTGLPKDSVVNVSQIATVDKSSLRERCGKVDHDYMLRVEEGIKLILDL